MNNFKYFRILFYQKKEKIQCFLLCFLIKLTFNCLNFYNYKFKIISKSKIKKEKIMIQEIRKRFPQAFLLCIIIIIVFLYVTFVKLLIIDTSQWNFLPTIIFLGFYHVVLFLLLWSIFQTIRKDPGLVPTHWGFSLQNKVKKYCLICHVFKPQRTHHCSACNRCVLNMDHHCPWINGCIGFYNRKPFILMLIYTIVLSFINILAFLLSITSILKHFQQQQVNTSFIIHLFFIVFGMVLNCLIFVTIFLFLKFHIELILSNFTTLQTLQLKRQGKQFQKSNSVYNLGKYYNWIQVFGKNSFSWWLPIYFENEGPSGDGVLWPKGQRQSVQDQIQH